MNVPMRNSLNIIPCCLLNLKLKALLNQPPLQSAVCQAVTGAGWSQRPVKHIMKSCPISLLP